VDLEEGLTVELAAITGLAGKVFPVMAAQGTKAPYLAYTLGSNDRVNTLSGHASLVQSQYQLDLYHSTYASLKTLKKLVIANIKTYDLRNIGVSGPFVQQVKIITDFDTYEDALELHKGIIEFDIYYNE
jgi:hypothetical protein